LAGTTIKLKLRWSNFTTLTRQVTLSEPTDRDDDIYMGAQQLLRAAWPKGRPVRLIGVGMTGLSEPAEQLKLWDESPQKERQLQKALDEVRKRFGRDAIQRAIEIEPSESP
jgi:hypothetical protein